MKLGKNQIWDLFCTTQLAKDCILREYTGQIAIGERDEKGQIPSLPFVGYLESTKRLFANVRENDIPIIGKISELGIVGIMLHPTEKYATAFNAPTAYSENTIGFFGQYGHIPASNSAFFFKETLDTETNYEGVYINPDTSEPQYLKTHPLHVLQKINKSSIESCIKPENIQTMLDVAKKTKPIFLLELTNQKQ